MRDDWRQRRRGSHQQKRKFSDFIHCYYSDFRDDCFDRYFRELDIFIQHLSYGRLGYHIISKLRPKVDEMQKLKAIEPKVLTVFPPRVQ